MDTPEDGHMFPFLKSWIETRHSVNMSLLPDMSALQMQNQQAGGSTTNSLSRPASMNGDVPPAGFDPNTSATSADGSEIMKDFGAKISDLKKENFSLKLRIYYMEERMQNNYSFDQEQTVKMNIELKVECDSLRKELQEKHDLLLKASQAVASLPKSLDGKSTENSEEVQQLKELMENKMKTSEKELLKARQDQETHDKLMEGMKKRLEELNGEKLTLNDKIKDLEEEVGDLKRLRDQEQDKGPMLSELQSQTKTMEEIIDQLNEDLEDKDSVIRQLKESLTSKQTVIELLNEEKQNESKQQQIAGINRQVEELRLTLKDKDSNLREAQRDLTKTRHDYEDLLLLQEDCQEHILEQQQRLDEFEQATRQMTEELEKGKRY